jgi:hypothetical protein
LQVWCVKISLKVITSIWLPVAYPAGAEEEVGVWEGKRGAVEEEKDERAPAARDS